MKYLKFIQLLFRYGNLRQVEYDFEARRKKIVHSLGIAFSEKEKNKKSLIRFAPGQALRTILSNLAYFKNAGKMNRMIFFVPEKKLIYVRILKSASTSILKELLPLVKPELKNISLSDEQVDALAADYADRSIPKIEGSTLFAIVRNPFERLVSVYRDVLNPQNDFSFYENYWFGVLKKGMTFPEFVKRISCIPVPLLGPHLAPQYVIIRDVDEIERINCFRIEKDTEALENFLTGYGIRLLHRNKQKEEYNYRSFYDSPTLHLVYNLYKRDIEVFGYQEEYAALQQLFV